VRKLRLAGESTSAETGQAWLERQIDTAIRAKLALTVTVAMPDGSSIDLQLEPASLAGGRLRARDRRSDLERTLPLRSITSVVLRSSSFTIHIACTHRCRNPCRGRLLGVTLPDGPLIVQSDRTVLLEVAHPAAEDARHDLAVFAELERAPEHIHTTASRGSVSGTLAPPDTPPMTCSRPSSGTADSRFRRASRSTSPRRSRGTAGS